MRNALATRFGQAREERGQSTVEAAIVLPVFLLLILSIAEFSWMLYCDSSLSSAISHMEYSISSADVASYGTDMDALVKDKIVESDSILKSGTLTVTNAKVKIENGDSTRSLPDSDLENFGIQSVNERTTKVNVDADIDFQPAHMFGNLFDVHFTRDVKSSSLAASTFELG